MIEVPVRVKDALRDGRRLKNYIFKVLNDDNSVDFTIDNDTLVKESVKIDERMCTGNQLKFGLCEGSSLEFQYFNHPNITGRQIQAFIEVQFVDENGDLDWYEIPMGFFTVDQCPMQFSTGIRKVTAYNKLKSAYLDEKANLMIDESFSDPNLPVTFYDIRNVLLDDFEIEIDDFEKVEITRSYAGTGVDRKLSGGSISYKEKYGVNSPLNYYGLYGAETSSSNTGYLFACAAESESTLDPDYAYKIKSAYDLERLEQCYYDEIDRLMSLSFNVSEGYMNRFMNPQSSSGTYFGSYLGWHDYFGICVEKSNGTKSWYSTIAYNAGLSNVVGTFKDLSNTTLTDCVKIYYHIPYQLSVCSNAQATGSYNVVRFGESIAPDGRWGYAYYRDQYLISIVSDFYLFKDYLGESHNTAWQYGGWNETYRYTDISSANLINVIPSQLPDITLREASSAVYELSCQFGKLDRETDLFSGITLNNSRLLPSDTLYPSDSLYPNGNSVRGNKSMYSKLWTDSQGVQTFRYLIITYKGLDENNQEVEKVLQRTVNADGTTDYNMSDNWLFKNLIWTDSDVGDYADAMVLKMQSVSWFPFEMWCAGLPYLETGDELEITTSEGTYTSYVLQRQLNGIQNLQDTFIDGELDIF